MSEPSSLADTHYRLSKKVAQLTKVVVHLNTVNESVELDKQKLRNDHAREIQSVKEEADAQLTLLRNEINAKDKAIRELTDRLIANEKEAQQRLIEAESETQRQLAAAEIEANAREAELKRCHEVDVKALHEKHSTQLAKQTETANDLSNKLQDSSKKHRAELASIREQLKKEHELALKRQRDEITNAHSDEVYRLKSQHEKIAAQIKVDAADREKVEVENAVTLVKAEYEQKICQQIIQHNQKCQEMKVELTNRWNAEVASLQEELSGARAIAQEVPSLKDKIYEYADVELKLQSEVRRLQVSLDASTASNMRIIDELKGDNVELKSKVDEVGGALKERNLEVERLERENNDLKCRLDAADVDKASLDVELKQLEERYGLLCNDNDEKNRIVSTLTVELDESIQSRQDVNKQLTDAREEVAYLSQYKRHTERSRQTVNMLRSELNDIKTHVLEIIKVFDLVESALVDWKSRQKTLHFNQVLQLENQITFLRGEVDRLESIKTSCEQSNKQAKAEKITLEQRIKTLELAAANVESARSGERLSFEKAMEELKAQHKKEKFLNQIVSQDEQDILRNKIAHLESDMKKQHERHDRHISILEQECATKIEELKATLSKVKYENAVDAQKFATETKTMECQLAAQREECKSLLQINAHLQDQFNRLQEKHHDVIEALREKHRQDAEEAMRVHVELFQLHQAKSEKEKHELSEKLKHLEREKESIVNNSQLLAAKIKSSGANVTQLLQETKQVFEDLKLLTQHDTTQSMLHQCQDELSVKLRGWKEKCIAVIDQEKAACEEAMSKLKDSCDAKMKSARKEVDDAKKMLFQTVRESDAKLERELRTLKEEHNLHIRTITNESKANVDNMSSKFKNLYREFETVVAAGGSKEAELSEKEKKISQLDMKIIDLTNRHDEEMSSVRDQHQSERASLMRDMLSKETMTNERFAGEKARLEAELNDVKRQLEKTTQQHEHYVSSHADSAQQIKSLQDELEGLLSAEKVTREKMLYFKRELENRETNYNTRFSAASLRTSRSGDGKADGASVLRVIQNPSESKDASTMPNLAKKQSQTMRKGSVGSKKKVVKSKRSTTSLPKLG